LKFISGAIVICKNFLHYWEKLAKSHLAKGVLKSLGFI
jgi:hypothetical protein